MPRENSVGTPSGGRKNTRTKLTLLACDNCRIKRLKCTYNERPCMNCRLYEKECKQTGTAKVKSYARSEQTDDRRLSTTQDVVISHNGDSVASSSAECPSALLNPPDSTSALNANEFAIGHQPMHSETISENSNDCNQSMLQLEELFANEFLRSSIPLNDFSSLGDFVQYTPMPLDGHFPEPPPLLSETGLYREQTGTPHSKPTPISPYSPQNDKVGGLGSLRPDTALQRPGKHIPPGLFIGIDKSLTGFIGLASTGATLATCIDESISKHSHISDSLNFEWLVQAGKYITRCDTGETVELSAAQLPPKSLATMCINAYFNNVHIHYPIIREQTFRTTWEAMYDPTQKAHRVSNYMLFCLVLTIGAASDKTNSATPTPMDQFSRELFQKACSLVFTPLTESSLVALQVILLLIIFLELNGQYSLASVMSGFSIRVCQAQGLHRKSPEDFDLEPEETKFRSQLWWISFHFETIIAMAEGRPTAVRELTYDVEVLPLCQDQQISPQLEPLASAVHAWTAGLTELRNRFVTITSLCIKATDRLAALSDLNESLMRWKDQIPVAHQPGHDVSTDSNSCLLVAPLHLEYFNLLRSVHWASRMTISMQPDITADHGGRSVRAHDMGCLSAARSFVQALNSITDGGAVKSLFPKSLNTNIYVSVSAVLYREICESPQRMAAKTDLECLRALKVHLERDSLSGEWHATLHNTMSKMLEIAEQLVRGEPAGLDMPTVNTYNV
ncbi:hypothetical protein B0A52_00977 [Exophiala mesophila]|uniref:Zn(2)-C6 fungal-type domain-containing protein n=1 Tax=Exophiala mesophila TaxID=212818 RepID=A0A438NIR1_EXOME|nr:hypothetical protein B0A52_00977 [Exophiala mesophila]